MFKTVFALKGYRGSVASFLDRQKTGGDTASFAPGFGDGEVYGIPFFLG
jgi:hypothetical protein